MSGPVHLQAGSLQGNRVCTCVRACMDVNVCQCGVFSCQKQGETLWSNNMNER